MKKLFEFIWQCFYNIGMGTGHIPYFPPHANTSPQEEEKPHSQR